MGLYLQFTSQISSSVHAGFLLSTAVKIPAYIAKSSGFGVEPMS